MIIVQDTEQLRELVTEVVNEVAKKAELKDRHRKLYNKTESAKLMGISLSYLHNLVNSGALPTVNGSFISGEIIDWFTGIGKTTEKQKKEIAEFMNKFKK